jgi:hypothetical protein
MWKDGPLVVQMGMKLIVFSSGTVMHSASEYLSYSCSCMYDSSGPCTVTSKIGHGCAFNEFCFMGCGAMYCLHLQGHRTRQVATKQNLLGLLTVQLWRRASKILWNIEQFPLDCMATHILWLEYHLNETDLDKCRINMENDRLERVKNTNISLSLFTSWPDNFCLVLLDFWSCWVWTLKWTNSMYLSYLTVLIPVDQSVGHSASTGTTCLCSAVTK